VARIRRGIRNENLTEGLVEAIEMCGRLLERRGVEIRPDDENELPNTVRTPETSGEEAPPPERETDSPPGDRDE
jgi:putative membrane protein